MSVESLLVTVGAVVVGLALGLGLQRGSSRLLEWLRKRRAGQEPTGSRQGRSGARAAGQSRRAVATTRGVSRRGQRKRRR